MKKLQAFILAVAAGSGLLLGAAPASADGYVPPDCTVTRPNNVSMTVRCSAHAYQAVVRCSLGDYYSGKWQNPNEVPSVAICQRGERTNWWVNVPD